MLQVPASLLIMSSLHILACVSVGHAYAALIATGIKQFESKAKADTTRMWNACKVTAKYGVILLHSCGDSDEDSDLCEYMSERRVQVPVLQAGQGRGNVWGAMLVGPPQEASAVLREQSLKQGKVVSMQDLFCWDHKTHVMPILHFLPLAVPFRVRGQQGVFKVAVSPADFDVPVPIDTHLSLFTDADLDYMLARRNVTSQVLMRAAESARTNQYEAQFRREE
jgi:hypothetical protein